MDLDNAQVPQPPHGGSKNAQNKNKAAGLPPVAKRNILTVHPLPRTLDKRQPRYAPPKRSHFGRLAKKGTKKAALARAESGNGDRKVPFQDALNAIPKESKVAAVESLLENYFLKGSLDVGQLEGVIGTLQLESDPIMIKGAAFLLKHGFFFSIIKVSYMNNDLHPRLLKDMKLLLEIEEEKQETGDSWFWNSTDRDLFIKQFQRLPIITHYKHVRRQLLSMEDQGDNALIRIEREMLMKVVEDFLNHLDQGHELIQTPLPSYAIEQDANPSIHIPGLLALKESVGTQTPPESDSNCVQVVLNVHPDPMEASVSPLSISRVDEVENRMEVPGGGEIGEEVGSKVHASVESGKILEQYGEEQLGDQSETSCIGNVCSVAPMQPENQDSYVKDGGADLEPCENKNLEPPKPSAKYEEEQFIASGSVHGSVSDSDDDCLSMLSFRGRGVDPVVDMEGYRAHYQEKVDLEGDASSEISLVVTCLDDTVSLTIRPRGSRGLESPNQSVGVPSGDSQNVFCDRISVVLEAKEGGIEMTLVPGGNECEELGSESSHESEGPHITSSSEKEGKPVAECADELPATPDNCGDGSVCVTTSSDIQHHPIEVIVSETSPTTVPEQDEFCVELKPRKDGIALVLSPKRTQETVSSDKKAFPLVEEVDEELISLENSTITERVSLKLLPRTPKPKQEESRQITEGTSPPPGDEDLCVKLIPVNERVSISLKTEASPEHVSPSPTDNSFANEPDFVSVEVRVQDDRFLLSLDPQCQPNNNKSRNVSSEEQVTVQLSLVGDSVSMTLTPTACTESPENSTQELGDQCERFSARLTPDESVSVVLTPHRETGVPKFVGSDSQRSERVRLEMAYLMDGVSLELQPQCDHSDLSPPIPATERLSSDDGDIAVHLDVEEMFSLVVTPQRQLNTGEQERALSELKMDEGAKTVPGTSQTTAEMRLEEVRTQVVPVNPENDRANLEETEGDPGTLRTCDETLLQDSQVSGGKIKQGGKAMIETIATGTEARESVSKDSKPNDGLGNAEREKSPDIKEPCTTETSQLSQECVVVEMHQEGDSVKVTVAIAPSGAEDGCSEAKLDDGQRVETGSTDHLDESVKVSLSTVGDSCYLSLAVNTQANSLKDPLEGLPPVLEESTGDADGDGVSVAQLKEEAEILEAEIDKERQTLQQEKQKLEEHLGVLMKVMEEHEEAESRASTPGNLQQLEAERLSLMKEIEQEKECLAAIVSTLASSMISPRLDDAADQLTPKGSSTERSQETNSPASPPLQCAPDTPSSTDNCPPAISSMGDGNEQGQAVRSNSGKDASSSAQTREDEPRSPGGCPDDASSGRVEPTAQEANASEVVPDTHEHPLTPETPPTSQSEGASNRCMDGATVCQIPEQSLVDSKTPETNDTTKDSASPEGGSSCSPNNALEQSAATTPEVPEPAPDIMDAENGNENAAQVDSHDTRKEEVHSIPGEDNNCATGVQAEDGTESLDQDENRQPASEPVLELDDAGKNAHASASLTTDDDPTQNGIQESLDAFQEQLAQTQQIAAVLQAYQPTTPEPDEPNARVASPAKIQVTPEDAKKLALLSEELKKSPDFDEPPTKEEVNKFAVYLGMDPEEDKEFLYIAEWALTAPLPAGWTVHLDSQKNEFYFNTVTKVSQYQHPMDGKYKELYQKLKSEKSSGEKDQEAQ
ncbi:hypothetical protein BSKO_08544 [Bryopsis sp. KO-2023]|nr:hypothetical protein BSKO_08544 [Bryopsis sp. KO-2023]